MSVGREWRLVQLQTHSACRATGHHATTPQLARTVSRIASTIGSLGTMVDSLLCRWRYSCSVHDDSEEGEQVTVCDWLPVEWSRRALSSTAPTNLVRKHGHIGEGCQHEHAQQPARQLDAAPRELRAHTARRPVARRCGERTGKIQCVSRRLIRGDGAAVHAHETPTAPPCHVRVRVRPHDGRRDGNRAHGQ